MRNLTNKDELHKSETHYSSLIETDPKNADNYFYRSFYRFALGEYRKALEDLNSVIAKEPRNLYALCLRGFVYSKLNENLKAIQDFNKSVEIDPDFSKAYICRAIYEILRGKQSMALKDLNRSVEIDRENFRAFLYRGKAHQASDNFNAAVLDFKKVSEMAPALAGKMKKMIDAAYLKGGICNADKEEYQKAIDFFKKYIENNTKDANAYFYLGEAYMNLEDYKNAGKYLTKASELDPDGEVGNDARDMMEIFNDIAEKE